MKVITLARFASARNLLIVIDRNGKTKLRRQLFPGDQKIGVAMKEAA